MKRWLKQNRANLILLAVFLVGIGLLVYPTFSDYWNSFHQSRAVASYAKAVSDIDDAEYDRILAAAQAYNAEIGKNGIHWTLSDEELEEYNNQLNVDDTGIMGYIEIKKINCSLPIYHGTNESVLQIAVGHIEGSSLPVGGESTHCVLSGHRGLPSARLFTDLDQMQVGDTFVIQTLDETLTYEVDKIRIVEPTDLSDLTIEEGKDLCTLVTCTPYGINTHRLLVRGHRIENEAGAVRVPADAVVIETVLVAPFVAVPILLLLLILLLTSTKRMKRKVN